MATLRPFRALRPTPSDASAIAAVPYDVVNTDEARALAAGNPLSFLRVSRAELELPPGTNPYADEVYDRAASNFDLLKASSLVRRGRAERVLLSARDRRPRADRGGRLLRRSTSTTAASIKKHERTRRDKEDDRTRHMIALGAQTGPVFLTYRGAADVEAIGKRATAGEPLLRLRRQRRCAVTRSGGSAAAIAMSWSRAFSRVPALYIADGHHRAASAARARDAFRIAGRHGPRSATARTTTRFSASRFRTIRFSILPYNRIVRDMGPLTPEGFLAGRAGAVRGRTGPADARQAR